MSTKDQLLQKIERKQARIGIIGLGLYGAGTFAEIFRAGLKSVDQGQSEAAEALGMTKGKIMRRIILPQAMRVIVPPTGNETIAMIKDTSLVAFVPYYELFFQLQGIGSRTFQVFPMLVAACLWYLAMTSILMVGQHFLERRYARGTRRRRQSGAEWEGKSGWPGRSSRRSGPV